MTTSSAEDDVLATTTAMARLVTKAWIKGDQISPAQGNSTRLKDEPGPRATTASRHSNETHQQKQTTVSVSPTTVTTRHAPDRHHDI